MNFDKCKEIPPFGGMTEKKHGRVRARLFQSMKFPFPMERGPAEQPGGMGDKKHYYHYPGGVPRHPFANEGELPFHIKFITKPGDRLTTDITTNVFESLFDLRFFDKV